MELSNWAPEHSDALRELIARGLSFSEAAQAINHDSIRPTLAVPRLGARGA
jgi:hypothetical protein